MKTALLIILLFSRPLFAWTLVGSDIMGWSRPELLVYVNPADCPVPESTINDIIDHAIEAWNGIPSAHITLKRAPEKSDVTVQSFIDGKATHVPVFLCDKAFGTHNAVDVHHVPAATRLAFNDSRIDYAGILLNAQAGAGAEISQLDKEELSVTLAHELGHVLGLGHSEKKEALMYYSIGGKNKVRLTQDDMDGIAYLYPRNLASNTLGCQAVHRDDTRILSMGWLWAALVVMGNILVGRLAVAVRSGRLPLSPEPLP